MAYDIRDDVRLRQVHKAMLGWGHALQYSVFVCDLDGMEKVGLQAELGAIINHRHDSVAIIDLGDSERRGRTCFEFLGPPPRLPTGGPTIV